MPAEVPPWRRKWNCPRREGIIPPSIPGFPPGLAAQARAEEGCEIPQAVLGIPSSCSAKAFRQSNFYVTVASTSSLHILHTPGVWSHTLGLPGEAAFPEHGRVPSALAASAPSLGLGKPVGDKAWNVSPRVCQDWGMGGTKPGVLMNQPQHTQLSLIASQK